jgi:predicted transcriptional regulator
MRISVELPDAQMRRLEETARRLKVSPEALAAAALQDMVGQGDKDFAKVADFVIKKNAELLRRLA